MAIFNVVKIFDTVLNTDSQIKFEFIDVSFEYFSDGFERFVLIFGLNNLEG